MHHVAQLISDYLDGELDDSGVNQLADSLRADQSTVDQLVLESFIHSQLHHWMNVRQLRDQILADAVDGMNLPGCSLEVCDDGGELESVTRDAAVRSNRDLHRGSPRQHWLGMLAALATVLLIGVSIYTAYLLATHRAIVAQLTQEHSCQWESTAQSVTVGSLLLKGQQLRLRRGRALVTFACGAQMMIEGPASVALASESKAELLTGRVGAKVPTQAIGFTVATPLADFVDLGTEFTLTLEPTRACELQVFDGLVELQTFESAGHIVEQRLRISEGSAVRLEAAKHNVVSIPYAAEQRIVP